MGHRRESLREPCPVVLGEQLVLGVGTASALADEEVMSLALPISQ